MRGDDRVLDYLNRSLRSELTSINQYWLHYRIQAFSRGQYCRQYPANGR